jgi:hypothetical protein
LGKFWTVLQWKMLVYFIGIFYGHLIYSTAVCYIFWPFGTYVCIMVILVYLVYQEKSGNPALKLIRFRRISPEILVKTRIWDVTQKIWRKQVRKKWDGQRGHSGPLSIKSVKNVCCRQRLQQSLFLSIKTTTPISVQHRYITFDNCVWVWAKK